MLMCTAKKTTSIEKALPPTEPTEPVVPGSLGIGSVSLAVAKAGAKVQGIPLYKHIASLKTQEVRSGCVSTPTVLQATSKHSFFFFYPDSSTVTHPYLFGHVDELWKGFSRKTEINGGSYPDSKSRTQCYRGTVHHKPTVYCCVVVVLPRKPHHKLRKHVLTFSKIWFLFMGSSSSSFHRICFHFNPCFFMVIIQGSDQYRCLNPHSLGDLFHNLLVFGWSYSECWQPNRFV